MMKFSLVLLDFALIFALTCALDCTDDSWSEYKEKFNKTYDSEEDHLRHRNIFCERLKSIDAHNELFKRNETTYEMGVNQFTDLASDELANLFGHHGLVKEKNINKENTSPSPSVDE